MALKIIVQISMKNVLETVIVVLIVVVFLSLRSQVIVYYCKHNTNIIDSVRSYFVVKGI